MRRSWNEIRTRAATFAQDWAAEVYHYAGSPPLQFKCALPGLLS
jgi:hypothetical protein